MALFLTFDIGTTGLKTALVGDGGLIAVHTVPYTFHSLRPGWAEMPPETYWKAAVEGTRAVIAAAGISPSMVCGIGFSSQGQTFVPVGKTGLALYDAIVWVDTRAREIAGEWASSWLSAREYRRISGSPWIPSEHTVFKIAWLARNNPQAHNAWKFLCLPDYLIYRMTGETVTDRITAQMSGMYNLQSGGWEPRLLAAAGINESQLPFVQEPGTAAGMLSPSAADELGISPGIPVCAGANDQIAGAIGAGNVLPGIATETTGTALAVVVTTPSLIESDTLFVSRHAAPGLGYVMSHATTSAVILGWLRDTAAPGMAFDELTSEAGSVSAGCDGLTVIPHFSGTTMPPNPDARGAFIGLTLAHTRAHLARAVMESCACLLQDCLSAVASAGMPCRVVRSVGGAAKSDLWLQMKADMLGVPMERPACLDGASLGAAMLAAVGTGYFNSLEEASEKWYRPSKIFEPDAASFETYHQVYDRYRDLCLRLYGI